MQVVRTQARLLEKDLPKASSPLPPPVLGSLGRLSMGIWVCISALTHTHSSLGRASRSGRQPLPNVCLRVTRWPSWGFSETLARCCLQLGASCHCFSVLYFSFSGFSLSSLLLAGASLSFALLGLNSLIFPSFQLPIQRRSNCHFRSNLFKYKYSVLYSVTLPFPNVPNSVNDTTLAQGTSDPRSHCFSSPAPTKPTATSLCFFQNVLDTSR